MISSISRRIVIKGTSGSGKTVLAAELARRLGVAHIELDALYHGPNWSEPTPEAFRATVGAALAAEPDGWVADGNYDSKLGRLLIDAADTIVWLDLPLRVKFPRLWRRTRQRLRGDVELWNGNRESWRGALLGWDALIPWMLRTHARHRREWPAAFGQDRRCVRLRKVAEVERWLANELRDPLPKAGADLR
jgi:adenylate kinase family enzyme